MKHLQRLNTEHDLHKEFILQWIHRDPYVHYGIKGSEGGTPLFNLFLIKKEHPGALVIMGFERQLKFETFEQAYESLRDTSPLYPCDRATVTHFDDLELGDLFWYNWLTWKKMSDSQARPYFDPSGSYPSRFYSNPVVVKLWGYPR